MSRTSIARIVSCSRWLAIVFCLLVVPLAARADSPGPFLVDNDSDGVPVPFDCDDTRADVHPAFGAVLAAPEKCDGRDNDCDGQADEDMYSGHFVGEHCTAGSGGCTGEGQYVCTGDFTAACDAVPQPNGTACDDGDKCTGPDYCTGGVCGGPTYYVVSPNNPNGWIKWDDTTDTPTGTANFVVGPGATPLGSGSGHFLLLPTVDRQNLMTRDYAGTRLDAITKLKYSTYRASADAGNLLAVSLQIETDFDVTDAATNFQGRLVFEPYQGAGANPVPQNTWQTWTPLTSGKWWMSGTPRVGNAVVTNQCPQSTPCTWAQVLAFYPNAGIPSAVGHLAGIFLRAGSTWPNFDGNVDAFMIGVNGVESTYDFEAADPCTDFNDCTTDSCSANACVHTNVAADTACGSSDNTVCNAPDTCDGAGTCVDRKKAVNTVCLAGTLPCDPNDVCDGVTNACAPIFASAGTACGDADNSDCNAPDTCNGGGGCVDNKKPNTFVCRADAGQCDVEETCTGTSNTCPADVFEPNTTNCSGLSNVGACDTQDKCSGTSNTCVDKFLLAGTACNDADQCTGPDVCPGTSGACGGPQLITVSPNNMNSWAFYEDNNDGPGSGTMVAGPGLTPLGTGSVRLALNANAGPVPPADRQVVSTFAYGGTRLSNITRLQYSTYRSSVDAGNNLAISLQFDVDYDVNDAAYNYQGRLVFEPYQGVGGNVSQNTWQTWTPLTSGKWWMSSNSPRVGNVVVANQCPQATPCTWAQVLGFYPNAGIHPSIGAPGLPPGRVLLKAGGPAPSFDGNADALIIGVSGVERTYNFEAVDLCSDNNDCTIDTCSANTCVNTARPDATTVAASDLNGWHAVSQRTGTAAFVPGAVTPPLGDGSYEFSTGPGNAGVCLPADGCNQGGKIWLGTEQFNGTKLSDITGVGYSTFIKASPGGNTINAAINLYIDLDGNGTRDTTLVFEPVYTYGNPTPGVWQTWDAYQGGAAKWWYTTAFGVLNNPFNDFKPLSYYIAQFPNAKIVSWYSTGNPVRSDGWGLNLVAGQNSAGNPWINFLGDVDNFTFSTSAPTSYRADFEPAARCDDSVQCTQDQCGSGVCVHPSTNAGTACGDNTETTCNHADTCDGAGACGANFASNATVCRASAGVCDLAETCDGAGSCPIDSKSIAECRAAGGVCDLAETCDGVSNNCPADAKSVAVCRPSAGVCDLPDSCDGIGNNCPADAKSTAECRPSAGECDLADSCDGVGNACPVDAKSTALCRASAGYCDVSESCDGSTNVCPADAFQAATTVCRPATEICDVAETCTGSSALCPAVDAVATTSQVCRPAAGGCDLAENCDGTNKACPADATSTAECRASAGACDLAESCTGGSGEAIYDSIPGPVLPYNLPSLGYQANQTSEFGDYVTFAGTNRYVTDVTVTMSAWALHSTYPLMDPSGWSHPITLNLYELGPGNTLGPLLKTVTQTMAIPWRPEADPTCPGGTAWRAADSLCYNGLAFDITFHVNYDLAGHNQAIFGIAYNTNTWGYAPIGLPGPYESLNVALRDYGASGPVVIGTDNDNDAVFWNTMTVGNYSTPCPGGTLCRDTAWYPYTPAVRFTALPSPSVACPSDAKSVAECRPSGGACDLADFCDGVGNDCPADAKSVAVCRPSAGACDLAESCDGSNNACPADAKSTAVCRAAAGFCDATETCDGSSNNCPADLKQPSSLECRAAAGVCDAAESCDGTTNNCPPDAKLTTQQSSFTSGFENPPYVPGSIDTQQAWSGGNIPINPSVDQGVDQSGSNSRSGSGAWRVSNRAYNGNFNGWPFSPGLAFTAGQPSSGADGDQFNATFYFRAASPVADGSNIEVDLGSTAGDDRNTFLGIRNLADADGGLVLRLAESDATAPGFFWPTLTVATNLSRTAWHRVDIRAKFYNGDNNDTFEVFLDGVAMVNARTSGTTWLTFEGFRNGIASPYVKSNRLFWRSGAAPSDLGAFVDASAQGFWFDDVSYSVANQASYTCRPATGDCDLAEVCDGATNDCPADSVRPNTDVCRASGGVCDLVENCDGSTKLCPADAKSTAVCRSSAGICDVVESCDGLNNNCPSDGFVAGGTQCRGSAGVCDAAESCTGSGPLCPADAFVPSSTTCRPAAGQCDLAENCTGSSAPCPSDVFKAANTACNDGLTCTSKTGAPATADACDGLGTCKGTVVTCASDGNDCTTDACHEPTGCANDPMCGISGVVYYNLITLGADVPAGDSSNPIEDAKLTLTGAASGFTLSSNTGTYAFSTVAGSITDTPTRTSTANDILSGLDSSDASLISKRSVGLVPPFTTRQFKAGDVSANGAISAFDAALVSQRFVGIITSWPAPLSSTSWFFDPVARALSVTTIPGPTNADFVGVLYGDVNMGWQGPSNPFAGGHPVPPQWQSLDPKQIQGIVRAKGAVSEIYVSQAPVPQRDGSYEMVLGVTQADGILGLDLSLTYDPAIVTIEGVYPKALSGLFALDSNIVSAGLDRVSMYSPAPMQGTGDFLVVRMRINGSFRGLPFELTGFANEGTVPMRGLTVADPGSQTGGLDEAPANDHPTMKPSALSKNN